jgi:hypothetical protein
MASKTQSPHPRREVGAGATIAAASMASAKGDTPSVPPLSDPSDKYPKPPFKLASIDVQLAAADASLATGQICGSAGGTGQP